MTPTMQNVLARLAEQPLDADETVNGFRDAVALAVRELRDAAIREHARYWSAERFAAFLLNHEALTRPQCTCHSCPKHSDADVPPMPGSN